MKVAARMALALMAAGAPAPLLAAPPFGQEARLVLTPGQGVALFGFSVSASGDTLVVGAIVEDTAGGADAGAAYVFVRAGASWTLQQRLTASDGAAGDAFGCSVSVSGDTLVVGSQQDDTLGGVDAGSAYVFVRTGAIWSEQQKLTAPDGAAADRFGVPVSLSGDTVAIGSHLADTAAGVEAGAAYVFVRAGNGWGLQQKLIAADGAIDDRFGFPVALAGDTLVAGAYRNDNANGADAGAAYVYTRAGTVWTEQRKLIAADGAAGDNFGLGVAADGDTVVVGAPFAEAPGGTDAGAAYVYTRAGTVWSEQQKLTAADGAAAADEFGRFLAVSGDTAVVGSYHANTLAGGDAGAAYLYTRTGVTWGPPQRLTAADGAAGDIFGRAVALTGDTIVIGADRKDTAAGPDAGAAYVFRPAIPSSYFTLEPCRLVDTRVVAQGPALAANSTRTFVAGGACQVPADARAVAAILIAVNPGELGTLRLYPTGQPAPLASALNFAAGRTRANNAVVPLGTSGQINVQCDMSAGSAATTHFVLDVFGYFR